MKAVIPILLSGAKHGNVPHCYMVHTSDISIDTCYDTG